MRDKRPVDELSLEELERILAIRKREARQERASRVSERRLISPHVAPLAVPANVDDPAEDVPQFEDEIKRPPRPAPNAITLTPDSRPTVTAPPLPLQPVVIDETPRFEEDHPGRNAGQSRERSRRTALWNRLLLVVEVAAVGGLAVLFVSLFSSIQAITSTTSQIQQDAQATLRALQVPPTATPTINLASLVLPGGHLYDETTNSARYNLDEVPAQYRDVYAQQLQNLAPAVRPTQNAQGPLNIRIPAIRVQSPVVFGDDWDSLKRGVGHHANGTNPGERGNMILSAHNDVFGEIFRDLEKLRPGDKIYVSTQSREYTYVVRSTEVVRPDEVRVLDNTRKNIMQVTLITCYPYRVDTHRYIVYGELEGS